MAKIELHADFKNFLRLLNSHGVEYLVVVPKRKRVCDLRPEAHNESRAFHEN